MIESAATLAASRVARPAFWAVLGVAVLAGCAPGGPAPEREKAPVPPPPAAVPPSTQPAERVLVPAGFEALAGWSADEALAALGAFRRSCPALAVKGPGPADLGLAGTSWAGGSWAGGSWAGGSWAGGSWDWRAVCAAAAAPASHQAARAFFERWFQPALVTDRGRDQGLLTGYFEPEMAGARRAGPGFAVPLYKRPDDLVSVDLGPFDPSWRGRTLAGRLEGGTLKPYPSRAEIEAGALRGRGLEIAWLADPVDAFVLHVQGSGRVRLPDGATIRLGFAGHNGRDYVSIGRELANDGALRLEDVTLPAIRDWLAANPDKARAMMARNPRFVFFRELPPVPDDGLGPAGPVGAAGVPLTPGRSLAVDRAFLPLGVPVWIDAADPRAPDRRLRRLVVAQDTGGAITGPVRGDLFWGAGAEAAFAAGRMKSDARFWVLLPKPPPAR